MDPDLYLFHLKYADAGAHGHFDELASELGSLTDRVSMNSWVTGSGHVKDMLEKLSRRQKKVLSPKEGAGDSYEVLPFGKDRAGAVVRSVKPAEPFILAEKFRALL